MAKKKKRKAANKDSLNSRLYDDAVVRAVNNLKFREDLVKRASLQFRSHDEAFLDRIGAILIRMSDTDVKRLGSGISLNRATDRTKALVAALRDLAKSSAEIARSATAELKALSFDEAQFWALRVNKHLPDELGITVAAPKKSTVNKAWAEFLIKGETINQSVNRWGRQRAEILRGIIRQRAHDGLEASGIIRGLGGKGGFLARNVDGSPNGLGLKLRTAATGSQSAGQKAFAAENDLIQDLVWTAVLDTRTSKICTARHGRLVNKELGGVLPPAHPNCRSITVPGVYNIRRAKELSKSLPRDALDIKGRIPEHETASEWLLRQTTETQKKVMGPSRWALWNSGRYNWPEDFVSARTGEVYTLEKLRKRNKEFFD